LHWQVVNYYQQSGIAPATLQTGENYEYRKTGNLTYELCATFNKESDSNNRMNESYAPYPPKGLPQIEDWSHPAGRYCFTRSINTVAYPFINRGL
jgi:hypothetical protein